jgi:thiol-disulfide isomerase/thioredoxin
MKKIFTLFFAFAFTLGLFSQTYFSQNFNASSSFPLGWVRWNVDNKTVAPQVSSDYGLNFGANAWIIAGTGNRFAVSTSYYTAAGASDDWMVSPPISLPANATQALLSFAAISGDGDYPESYELRLSLTDSLPSSFNTVLYANTEENAGANERGIFLGDYAGQTFRLAWRNISEDKLFFIVDDILIKESKQSDLAVLNTNLYRHNDLGTIGTPTGIIKNYGIDTVKNFTLNYQVNNLATVSENITGISLPPYSIYSYTASTPFSTTTAGEYGFKVWASNINSFPIDSNSANDTVKKTTFFYTTTAKKKVVMEEFTGAWCGYCPEGHTVMADLMESDPNLIGISVHSRNGGGSSADKMEIPEGDSIVGAFASGFPSATFDRLYIFDNPDGAFSVPDWYDALDVRKDWATPANVSFENFIYDSTIRQVTVDVKADFLVNMKSKFGMNLMFVEDSVIGTGAGYNQRNYFCSGCGADDANSPFYNSANSIANYPHNNVLRKSLAGTWGSRGVLPDSVVSGGSYTQSFSYVLPASWKAKNVRIVGVLQEYTSSTLIREILNAEQAWLIPGEEEQPNSVAEAKDKFAGINLFPNPASDVMNLQFDLLEAGTVTANVVSVLGENLKEVFNGGLNTGVHSISYNTNALPAGTYFLKLQTNNSFIVKTFAVVR